MTKARDITKIDSGARTNTENTTQNVNTLDAMFDTAKSGTEGKRQDSAYGRAIPVLIFHVSEIGFGDKNHNPIVLHPKLASVGARTKEKILEFRGIPARGLGSLCYSGPIDNERFKSQTQLMTQFYRRTPQVQVKSGDPKDGDKQVTQDVKFFKNLLKSGPLTALCTIDTGDNYGYIDSFEPLKADKERKTRTEKGKSDKRPKFRKVGDISTIGSKVVVNTKVKLLSSTLEEEVPPPVTQVPPEPEPEPPEEAPPPEVTPLTLGGRPAVNPNGPDRYKREPKRIPEWLENSKPDVDGYAVAQVALDEFENWPIINGQVLKEEDSRVWDIVLKYVIESKSKVIYPQPGPPYEGAYKWYKENIILGKVTNELTEEEAKKRKKMRLKQKMNKNSIKNKVVNNKLFKGFKAVVKVAAAANIAGGDAKVVAKGIEKLEEKGKLSYEDYVAANTPEKSPHQYKRDKAWMWSAVFIRWCCLIAGYPLPPPDAVKANGLRISGSWATHNGYALAVAQRTLAALKDSTVEFPLDNLDWIYLNGPDIKKLDSSAHPYDAGAREIPSYKQIGYELNYGDIVLGKGGAVGFHCDILTPKGIIGGNLRNAVRARTAHRVYGILTLNKHAKDLLTQNGLVSI